MYYPSPRKFPTATRMSGLGEYIPKPEELAAQINMPAAQEYNRKSAQQNSWSVAASAGGVSAGSPTIATEVAMFQYATGVKIDGLLGPATLKALRAYQKTNYFGYTDKRIYGASLAQHISIGSSSSSMALAAKYNKGEADRRVFSIVGSYYDGPDDPKLASDIAVVQGKHGLPADGRMTPETASLFKSIIREGGSEGKTISGSFRFFGVEPTPGSTVSESTPAVVGKKTGKKRKQPPVDRAPPMVEASTGYGAQSRFQRKPESDGGGSGGLVVGGLLAVAAGVWYYFKKR